MAAPTIPRPISTAPTSTPQDAHVPLRSAIWLPRGAGPVRRLPVRRRAAQLLGLWHLTSLDAPTVAITWCLAFASAVRVHLPLWLPVVLGLAAWAFYVGDRVLDARRTFRGRQLNFELANLQSRHLFHWKHRRILIPLAIAAAVLGIVLVLRDMPMAARQRNTLLAISALAYFSSVHAPRHFPPPRFKLGFPAKLGLPKELLVGVIFTLACALPSWSRLPVNRLAFLPVFLVFAALAWLNCHAIEAWESEFPHKDHSARIGNLSILLGAVAMLLAGLGIQFHQPRMAGLLTTAAASSLGIAILHRYRGRLDPTTLRAAADLVLLTPMLLIL